VLKSADNKNIMEMCTCNQQSLRCKILYVVHRRPRIFRDRIDSLKIFDDIEF